MSKAGKLLRVLVAASFTALVIHAQVAETAPPEERGADAAALIDQAGVVAVKSKAADTKQSSSLATSTGAAAGASTPRSTAPPSAASAASLTEVQQPRGKSPSSL